MKLLKFLTDRTRSRSVKLTKFMTGENKKKPECKKLPIAYWVISGNIHTPPTDDTELGA